MNLQAFENLTAEELKVLFVPTQIKKDYFLNKAVKDVLLRVITFDFIEFVGCHKKNKKELTEKKFNEYYNNHQWDELRKNLNIDLLFKYLLNNQKYHLRSFNLLADALTYKLYNGFYPLEITNELYKRHIQKNDLFYLWNTTTELKEYKKIIKELKINKPLPNHLKIKKLQILFKNDDKGLLIYNSLSELEPEFNFMVYDDSDIKNKVFFNTNHQFNFNPFESLINQYYLNTSGINENIENIYNKQIEDNERKLKNNDGIKPKFNNNDSCFICLEDNIKTINNYKKCGCNCFMCVSCFINLSGDILEKCSICKKRTKADKIIINRTLEDIKNEYEALYNRNENFIINYEFTHHNKKLFVWYDGAHKKEAFIYKTESMNINLIIKEYYINSWYEGGFIYEYLINNNFVNYNHYDETEARILLKALSGGYDENKENEIDPEEFDKIINKIIDWEYFIDYTKNYDEDDQIKNILIEYVPINEDDNIYYNDEFIYYSKKEAGDICDLFKKDFNYIVESLGF